MGVSEGPCLLSTVDPWCLVVEGKTRGESKDRPRVGGTLPGPSRVAVSDVWIRPFGTL